MNLSGTSKGYKTHIDPWPITQDYVPAGTRTFQVESVKGYKVGDRVSVVRLATAEWLKVVRGDKYRWRTNHDIPP